MPSAFDNYFAAAAAPSFMDQFGERVIYTSVGGTAQTITAIVRLGEGSRLNPVIDGVMLGAMTEIDVYVSDCPDLLPGDVFTIRGEDYRLEHVPRKYAGGLATITASDVRVLERSDGGVQRVRG